MRLRLVTVAFDPECGAFPAEPLADVVGELVTVVEHFFHHEGLPHLLLVVHFRPQRDDIPKGRGRKRPKEDPAAALSATERDQYERLRAWRKSRAEADGVPVYVICTNQQLVMLVLHRPKSLAELREMEGIGDGKSSRYGRDLLQVLASGARTVHAGREEGGKV